MWNCSLTPHFRNFLAEPMHYGSVAPQPLSLRACRRHLGQRIGRPWWHGASRAALGRERLLHWSL